MAVKRPLVWVSVALVGGAAFSSAFGPPFPPFLAAFLSTLFLAVFLIILEKRAAAVAVLASSFLLGNCAYLAKAYVSEIPDQLAQHYASDAPVGAKLRGTASECLLAPDGERLTFVVDVESIETENTNTRVKGRTRVSWYRPGAQVEPGDIVEVTGRLRLLSGFKNPRVFDYERYMHRRGVFSTMYARWADAVEVQGKGQMSRLRRLREYFRREGIEIISRSTRTEEARAFIAAILLGERGLLTEEMETWFKNTGTFHVLAISGLHVGLIYLIVSLALMPLPLGTKSRIALSILAVWIYAYITGGRVSVTRASIMLTLVLSGYYLGRDGDFLTSVAFAALVIVGLDPAVVDELGFQLSFAAVVLLCTFEPFFTEKFYPMVREKLPRIPSPILNRLAITMFASLVIGVGMIPLQAYHFNLVSFVFPVANLIVIPILSLVLASAFASLLVGFVWLKAAMVFGLAAEAFAWIIFGTVKLCSMAPASSMRVTSPPIWVLGLEALAVTLVWWRPHSMRRLAAFAVAAALMVGASVAAGSKGNPLRATFLEVGDADACFLEFPSGETMLVDTGFATPNLDCGERLIAPYLWKKRVTEIDTLVLTHPDADHTGGALFLIENFRIGRLLLPELGETPPEFEEIIRAMELRGCTVETATAGDVLAGFDSARVEVLNPPLGASRKNLSDNDASVVLRITYGETSLFLGGDAGRKAFRFMRDSGAELRSQVMKASHHGLKSGFDKELVGLVQPD
ncbi:MAG: DNA internalization-related competence protein ComEC/Rec2, partial [Candidatus Abyssubacteria bacterium]|nr:DNA internalization-related competence protein ComEC/Rec2 [Candidatus Abyssubacteria bacterium]